MYPIRQGDTSRLPAKMAPWDKSLMEEDAETPLAQELRRLMRAKGENGRPLGAKNLALMAGLGATYVRDLLKGRSKSPEAEKLKRLADALGCPAARLLDLAGAAPQSEVVDNASELLLLITWRQLSEQQQHAVRDFINFTLSQDRASDLAVRE